MKTDLYQSCGHCCVFQIFWHIECSTLTASSFSIWNSSTGILSPPPALFIVMLPNNNMALLLLFFASLVYFKLFSKVDSGILLLQVTFQVTWNCFAAWLLRHNGEHLFLHNFAIFLNIWPFVCKCLHILILYSWLLKISKRRPRGPSNLFMVFHWVKGSQGCWTLFLSTALCPMFVPHVII